MNKILKKKKFLKEIKKKIINIILTKYNHIIGKKNIIDITYINISKNFNKIYIYINFINQKKKKIIKKNIFILQNSEINIIKILKKKMYLKYIPKIYFIYDKFNKKKNHLLNKIEKANKKNV